MWMRRNKLEWFWRLANAPRRMTTRYAQCAFALFKLACPTFFPRSLHLSVVEPGRSQDAAAAGP